MPRKRGTALKSKIVDREKKFEAEHHRAEEKRRRRAAEREVRDEGRSEAAGDAPPTSPRASRR